MKWLLVFALFAVALAWARPITIKCPVDNITMYFDHKVGYGDDAVCWYHHNAGYAPGDPKEYPAHDAYTPCGD